MNSASYFVNGYYFTVQRFNSEGTFTNNSGEMQLTNDGTWAQKIFYVKPIGSSEAPALSAVTNGKGHPLLAAIALSGIHTCSNSNLNGFNAYTNWLSSFITNKGNNNSDLNVANLVDYTIIDYASMDTEYRGRHDYSFTAYEKYAMTCRQAGSVPVRISSLANLNWLIDGQNGYNSSIILIVVASSLSLLSITALSVLVIKKRKSKEQ